MPNKLLICEGPCNPTCKAVDQEVEAIGLGSGAPTPIPDPPALVARLRALKHTPHIEVSPSHFACVECGFERRF